jgi:glycogen debranching enzyme
MEHGDRELLGRYAPNIAMAVGYIKRHINELGLFVEDPLFAGIEGPERHGALKVTYWKDSELNRIESTTPHYPIVYSLAHFQNAEALVRLGRIVGDEDLEALGALMMGSGIKYLWRGDHFVTALDSDGIIDASSSDSLHCLLYIPPEFLPAGFGEKIESYSMQLETPAGYRAGIPVAPTIDPYHTMTVWTHEQALLHVAAKKYGLVRAQAVAERIVPYIHPERGVYPEYIHAVTLQPGGNPCQAWAMGAYIYFKRPTHALL